MADLVTRIETNVITQKRVCASGQYLHAIWMKSTNGQKPVLVATCQDHSEVGYRSKNCIMGNTHFWMCNTEKKCMSDPEGKVQRHF